MKTMCECLSDYRRKYVRLQIHSILKITLDLKERTILRSRLLSKGKN